jgi:branched-chain amino acid transport system permease protein
VSTFLLYVVLSLPLVGAYALLGLGITVIYQASRVLNLAHGAMAMGGAYATYQLAHWHVPLVAAVVGGVLAGAVLGIVVERVFVRQLRQAGPTTQTVGTVAALTFAIAIAARIWGTLPVDAPRVLPKGALRLGDGFVPWTQFGIFPISLAGAAILFVLFKYTDIGLAMRGAAQNRRGAALRGVDPDRTAMLAWILGGAFAALAGILLAGATELDPFSVSLGVLPAFVAALIGGLESMPGVCIGALIVGVVQGMVPYLATLPRVGGIMQGQGAPELVLSVLALIVMALRGARLVAGDVRSETL